MKKSFWLIAVAFMTLTVAGLSSCKKSAADVKYDKLSYGILKYINGNYIVTTDDNQNLYVTNEEDFDNGVFSGRRGRVLIGYNEIGNIDPTRPYYDHSAASNLDIEMVAFLSFVSSDIKIYSSMTDTDLTAMGDDELDVNKVTFGNGYINIMFSIFYNSANNMEHKLTMVYNDEKVDGKIHLYLMHNSYTDVGGADKLTVNSSFNLYDFMSEDTTSADIVLHWWWHTSDTDLTLKEYTAEYNFVR